MRVQYINMSELPILGRQVTQFFSRVQTDYIIIRYFLATEIQSS